MLSKFCKNAARKITFSFWPMLTRGAIPPRYSPLANPLQTQQKPLLILVNVLQKGGGGYTPWMHLAGNDNAWQIQNHNYMKPSKASYMFFQLGGFNWVGANRPRTNTVFLKSFHVLQMGLRPVAPLNPSAAFAQ